MSSSGTQEAVNDDDGQWLTQTNVVTDYWLVLIVILDTRSSQGIATTVHLGT